MTGHVVRADDVPAQGENFMFLDPAGRNFFMLWVRRAQARAWVYREWPGRYHIPGVGVPEPWAVPSSRNPKKGNDGERGGAQESWQFGLLRYKFEIARLEQWADWRAWAEQGVGPDEVADYELLREWADENGTAEPMECRYVDSRAATAPKTENDRVTTLHTDLNEMGMWWALSPANRINDDVIKIQTALDSGELYISEECHNLRWSLVNWTGADGEKGACKDPVDCLRWFYGAGLGERLDVAVPRERRRAPVRTEPRLEKGTMAGIRARRPAPGGPRIRWRMR